MCKMCNSGSYVLFNEPCFQLNYAWVDDAIEDTARAWDYGTKIKK